MVINQTLARRCMVEYRNLLHYLQIKIECLYFIIYIYIFDLSGSMRMMMGVAAKSKQLPLVSVRRGVKVAVHQRCRPYEFGVDEGRRLHMASHICKDFVVAMATDGYREAALHPPMGMGRAR
jgi:hypothetical protein